MTWWMEDDSLYDSQLMQAIGMEANGLRIAMCGYVGRQIGHMPGYDRTFNMRNIQSVALNARTTLTPAKLRKLTDELVNAGAWCRLDTDTYRIVESAPFGRFAGGPELAAKRAEAGRKGGKASGRSRRAKTSATEANSEANASETNEANASSKTEAIASDLLQAKPKQTRSDTDTYTDNHPYPSRSETEAKTVSLDQIVTSTLAKPLESLWHTYPKPGRKTDAAAALETALADTDFPTLYAACVRYTRAVQTGEELRKTVPTLGQWLTEGQWRRWQPDPPRTYEWGGISRQWLKENIEAHIPANTFTRSIENGFWGAVKTVPAEQRMERAKETARNIVEEINHRARRTTSPAAS